MKNQDDLAKSFAKLEGSFILYNERSETPDMAIGGVLPISKKDHDEIAAADALLHEFFLFYRKIEEIKMNYEAILENDAYWTAKLLQFPGQVSIYLQQDLYIDTNRKLTNFIVSLKSFIDDLLIKRKLPSIFGANSPQLAQFVKKTNYWYDNHLSYKFLMRLRDYAVHYDFPIQILNCKYDFDKARIDPLSVLITTKFRKSTLLNNSEFNKKLGIDLKSYNEEFPLKPFLTRIKFIFDDLLTTIIKISGNRYTKPSHLILKAINSVPNPGTVSYGKMVRSGSKVGPETNILNANLANIIISLSN